MNVTTNRIKKANRLIESTGLKLANQIVNYNEGNALTLGYAHIDLARRILRLNRIRNKLLTRGLL